MDLYNRVRSRDFKDMYPSSEFLSIMGGRINHELFEKGKLPHGMILYSDYDMPGVGKTTAARITAVMLNSSRLTDEQKDDIYSGRPSEVCIEINVADVRRIDDARMIAQRILELRDAMFNYNYVFIFDEAHKLTQDAQEVLMKPIEDCPENVYIIFCTTNMAGILGTLKSRMESHKFYGLDMENSKRMMKEVVISELSEKDIPSDETLESIHRAAKGAPRQCLVLLSQYLDTGSIDVFVEKEAGPLFKEYVELYERLARTGEVSWVTGIMPMINRILKENDPEKARIDIIIRLASVVSGLRAAPPVLLDTYDKMYSTFREPIGYIGKTDFIMRSYSVFIWVLNRRNSGEKKKDPKSETKSPEV